MWPLVLLDFLFHAFVYALTLCCVGGILTSIVFASVINTKLELVAGGDADGLTKLSQALSSPSFAKARTPQQCMTLFPPDPKYDHPHMFVQIPHTQACPDWNTVPNFLAMLCFKRALNLPQRFTLAAAACFIVSVPLFLLLKHGWLKCTVFLIGCGAMLASCRAMVATWQPVLEHYECQL